MSGSHPPPPNSRVTADAHLLSGVIDARTIADFTMRWLARRAHPSGSEVLLRIIHQPNLLAYWRLIGQFTLASRISGVLAESGVLSRLVYIVNDYDAWTDERFRSVQFPALGTHSEFINLTVQPLARTPSNTLIAFLGRIPSGFASRLRDRIRGALFAMTGGVTQRERGRLRESIEGVLTDIDVLVAQCDTWAHFC